VTARFMRLVYDTSSEPTQGIGLKHNVLQDETCETRQTRESWQKKRQCSEKGTAGFNFEYPIDPVMSLQEYPDS